MVAPMRTMSPDSTWARRASCCALLKRWISSMKTTVRRPSRRRRSSAARRTSRTSFTPERTALIASKWAFVRRRITKASVVLPEPGGPQRMSERSWSCSIARRRGRPGPSTSSWPRISSSVRGRTRSASGASGRGSSTGIWWSRPLESRSSGKSDPVSSPRGRAIAQSLAPREPALPRRLEQHERGGDADVEALDRPRQRDAQPGRGARAHGLGQAGALAAHHERHRAAQVGLVVAPLAVGGGGEHRDPARLERVERRLDRRDRGGGAGGRRCPSSRAAPSRRRGRRSPSVRIAPLAPAASAVRSRPPRLPGFCTPSATSTSGVPRKTRSSSNAGRRARARRPCDVSASESEANSSAARRRTGTSRPRSAERAAAPAGEASARGEVAASTTASPARERLEDELGPLEQAQLAIAAALLERAEPLVERVLAAAEGLVGGHRRGEP